VASSSKDDLPDLLKKMIGAKSALGSHQGAMGSVRRARNGVQHDGTIPSAEQAGIAAGDVERFLRAVVHAALGKTLEEITLVELVRDPRAKALLREAETKLSEDAEDARADACTKVASAFSWATGNMFRA